MGDSRIILPPGFHFHPTDEELIGYFLHRKVTNLPCNPSIIPELDLCSTDPWELNEKALMSQNQWYFFSQVIQGRATEKGHWEELDMDEDIVTSAGKKLGIKKYWVFCIDQVQKRIQTNWVMEEYHLFKRHVKKGRNGQKDLSEWVLCRVHHANADSQGIYSVQAGNDDEVELSLLDEVFLSMEDNDDATSFPKLQ
ncbi:NAC domain-containing protein 104-like [Coffea eugenioides]|uniref:NAC domain-containing protein 104-like n=1 Tax=Coffea eugenioides TaxID=49369 RepID=UPI000F60AF53|nr:NAC domain-containing protein 104-like [Coffea eugenioides]